MAGHIDVAWIPRSDIARFIPADIIYPLALAAPELKA